MSKILAIKGDKERGNEVIALLEMLGGDNVYRQWGKDDGWHTIEGRIILYKEYIFENDYITFTLDEFYKKYPFKIGDKVTLDNKLCTITWMCWECNNIYYYVQGIDVMFQRKVEVNQLKPYKEQDNMETTVEINKRDREDVLFDSIIWHLRKSVNNGKQHLSGGDCEAYFRELVKKVKETITPTPDITADVTDKNNCGIQCPDGYEFYDENGNLIGNKVMMRPKKPKYPNNFDECFNTVADELNDNKEVEYFEYKYDLLDKFKQLLICRDAYWKIAGEQMGLDKPWKHNYLKDANTIRYAIYNTGDEIVKLDGKLYRNYILCFPTEEMRDAFYENFKDMI